MLIQKHLKIMNKAHGCEPIIEAIGSGLGRCAAYRWYTQKTNLELPPLPLPMVVMRFDGYQKIWAITRDLQLSEKFSLPGQISIIPSNTPTSWKLVSQFDVVGVIFENEEVRRKLENTAIGFGETDSENNFFQSFYDPFILNITKQLVRLDQCKNSLSGEFVDILFKSLEIYIVDHLSPEVVDTHSESGSDRQVNYAVTKLTTQMNSKISIQNIAEDLGVSPSYLSRIFKQKVGLSPHEFLLYRRLERVKTLLLNTQLSIERIAEESGFNSHSHLTRYFSDYMGMPPSKYRRHMTSHHSV